MRKTLAAGLAALTFGGAVAASAIPATAEARDYHGGYHNYGGYYRGDYGRSYHHHNNNAGPAIIAGIAGLAIGAALADSGSHRSYYNSYNSGYGYRTCQSSRWVWDPYIGRRVLVTSNYAC